MSDQLSFQKSSADSVTVSFGERFQASGQFDQVFKEGMALVERTAAYLDGAGRQASKALTGEATVLYTTESMRLTTRLLDLASWLLIRRALKDGEISEDEARKKRARVKLQSLGRPSHTRNFTDLPEGLQRLIEESFSLHDRIVQLDLAMSANSAEAPVAALSVNPVGAQILKLERAFGPKFN
jgi:regulator of CtrA degradation